MADSSEPIDAVDRTFYSVPKLTIVIPVYNEIDTLPAVLDEVRSLRIDKEIIVVDNVSTDGTREFVESLAGEPGVSPVLQKVNYGKGSSVRLGLALARGEYVVVQDADLEYDPHDIITLLAIADSERRDAVFGSRLMTGQVKVPWHHALGRDALSLLFGLLYCCRLTDVATCYKLMRTDVAQSLLLRTLGFDLDYELPAQLRRRGVDIVEAPIAYHPRTIEQGKKLRWTDGIAALRAIVACLLPPAPATEGLEPGTEVILSVPPFNEVSGHVLDCNLAEGTVAIAAPYGDRVAHIVVQLSTLGITQIWREGELDEIV